MTSPAASPPPPKTPLHVQAKQLGRVINQWFNELKSKFKDLAGTNYRLGQYHLERGNLRDAQLRFWFVARLKPQSADAWIGLAKAQLAMGKLMKAKESVAKARKLQPGHEDLRLISNALEEARSGKN